jgi:muramidase (phage lysozyme)
MKNTWIYSLITAFGRKKMTTPKINPCITPLLSLIGHAEGCDNYDVVYGGKILPLSQTTVYEVLRMQERWRREGARSTAVGKYQFIYKTLKELQKSYKIPLDANFNGELQDYLAELLLKRRGLDDFLKGSLSPEKFMLNLSKEWASLPKDKTGVSYYAGDGLNKALVTPEKLLGVLEEVLKKRENLRC